MNQRTKISILILLCFVFCSLTGIAAAAYTSSSGGFFSSHTDVSVIGSVNETVVIQIAKENNGTIEKNQWISEYTDTNPSSKRWSSQFSVGGVDGGQGWNFERIGLPVTWKFQKTELPAIWKNLPDIPPLISTPSATHNTKPPSLSYFF